MRGISGEQAEKSLLIQDTVQRAVTLSWLQVLRLVNTDKYPTFIRFTFW